MKNLKKKSFSKPTLEYEYIQNLTLVQKLFFMIKERKDVDIQKVIFNQMSKLKILVNFQFMKWFHGWVLKKRSEMVDGEIIENR